MYPIFHLKKGWNCLPKAGRRFPSNLVDIVNINRLIAIDGKKSVV